MMYVFLLVVNSMIVAQSPPISLAVCEQLKSGMILKLRAETGNTMIIDTGEWQIKCEPVT